MNLKERLVDHEIIKQENAILEKTIPFIEGKPYGMIGARVIGSFVDASGPALIIYGGKNQGISGGAFALTGDRVLVGRVATLYPDLATVTPLRNVGMTLGVFVIPQTNNFAATSTPPRKIVDGLLIGKGNDLIIDLIPNETDIRPGDFVVTNGFGEGGIRDLLVGEVSSVKTREAATFQDIHVSETVPFKRVRSVLIITQQK
jgi:rod shape-determining protein MreC